MSGPNTLRVLADFLSGKSAGHREVVDGQAENRDHEDVPVEREIGVAPDEDVLEAADASDDPALTEAAEVRDHAQSDQIGKEPLGRR